MRGPDKFTPSRVKRLCDAYGMGMTQSLAAQYAGISRETIRRWLNMSRAGKDPFVGFAEKIEQAEAEGAAHALEIVIRAAKRGTWQAAAWLLERRHGYRRDAPVDVTLDDDKDKVDVEAFLDMISPEKLAAALKRAGYAPGKI